MVRQNKLEYLMFQDSWIFVDWSRTYPSTAPLYQQGYGFTCKYQFYKIASFLNNLNLSQAIWVHDVMNIFKWMTDSGAK